MQKKKHRHSFMIYNSLGCFHKQKYNVVTIYGHIKTLEIKSALITCNIHVLHIIAYFAVTLLFADTFALRQTSGVIDVMTYKKFLASSAFSISGSSFHLFQCCVTW